MKQLIRLGKELSEIAHNITDIYITKDYYSEVKNQYDMAVDSYVDDTDLEDNDFNRILKFREVVTTPLSIEDPCTDMTVDTTEVISNLSILIKDFPELYGKYIYPVFRKDIANMDKGLEHRLMRDCLKSISSGSSSFRKNAINLDSYMGSYFTTKDLLRSLISYGRLSGLMDWWTNRNLKYT